MTWSSRTPRAVRRDDASTSPPPSHWALDELAGEPRAPARRSPSDAAAIVNAVSVSADFERQLDDAYSRGYEEGRQAGEIAEAARLRSAVAAVNEAMASLVEEGEKWIGNAEENICALSVAVAKQVLGHEVAMDQATVVEIAQRALDEFPVDQPLIVRLNPGDVTAVMSAIGTVVDPASLGPRRDVQWMADARIAPGGCLIEGRERIVDGRIDTALERLYRRLTYTGA